MVENQSMKRADVNPAAGVSARFKWILNSVCYYNKRTTTAGWLYTRTASSAWARFSLFSNGHYGSKTRLRPSRGGGGDFLNLDGWYQPPRSAFRSIKRIRSADIILLSERKAEEERGPADIHQRDLKNRSRAYGRRKIHKNRRDLFWHTPVKLSLYVSWNNRSN